MSTMGSSRLWGKIIVLVAVCGWALSAHAKYGGGSGTEAEPFRISAVSDWQELMITSDDWNEYFILTANLNLAGVTPTPVGNASTLFTGVFDGNHNIISNAVISQSDSDYIGLFGYVGSGGQIRNLGVENVNMTGRDFVGGLVGYNYAGTLTVCYATGSVTGTNNLCSVGGLVGYNHAGTLTTCYATGSVWGRTQLSQVGGLVGRSDWGTLTSCYATGSVIGDWCVGGLVGFNMNSSLTSCYAINSVWGSICVGGLVAYNAGTLTACYATGSVTGSGYAGGLVGYNGYGGYNGATLTACYATGSVTGAGYGSRVGGLVGANNGTVTACYASGSVRTTYALSRVGGLVGYNGEYGTLTACYATGSVSGTDWVGGLVGYNGEYGTLIACYASGSVTGTNELSSVGGLVGYNLSSLTSCYATGSVSGTGQLVGGLVGWNYDGTLITACFWDTQTSGQMTSDGGTGKTTAEMQTKSTFTSAGWDFVTPVWTIRDGLDYPRLWWEISNAAPVADAGEDRNTPILFKLTLDGSRSYDPDEDYPLIYSWQIVEKPQGSAAELSNPDSVDPSLTPDLVGEYIIELVVTDNRGLESEPNYLVITAITVEQATDEKLTETIEQIGELDPNNLNNPNSANALINKLNATLAKLDAGLYQDALDKLRNDILKKTDGCANTGQPDKNDWILTCEDQAKVYPLVVRAIELLQRLLE